MKPAKLDVKSTTLAKDLYDSLANTGFAVLTNHGIDQQLLKDVYAEWEGFFDYSGKMEYKAAHGGASGFFPMKSENAKGFNVKDLKEFFHLFYPYRNIPEGMTFSTAVLATDLDSLGQQLLVCIDSEYEKRNKEYLCLSEMADQSKNTLFRILHYPPLPLDAEEGAVRAAPHEDINLITLLPSATFPGLAVKDNEGQWHLIDSDEGEIIVNVGDMLMEATGGKLKSTTHKVLNPTGLGAKHSRYSMPLFVHAHPETRISERYTAGEYLDERLKEIGLKV